jgi:hypothetical protein
VHKITKIYGRKENRQSKENHGKSAGKEESGNTGEILRNGKAGF